MIGTKYTPNGQWVSSFTRRYTDGWECKTTLFDVGDAELTSTVVDCGTDGFTLGREVAKVGVSSSPKGLSVSFPLLLRWSSVRGSVIEETHTGVDTITSFFEDETSDEPWLVIVEPD